MALSVPLSRRHCRAGGVDIYRDQAGGERGHIELAEEKRLQSPLRPGCPPGIFLGKRLRPPLMRTRRLLNAVGRQSGSEQKPGNERPAGGRGLSSPGLAGSRVKRGLRDRQPGIRSASLQRARVPLCMKRDVSRAADLWVRVSRS